MIRVVAAAILHDGCLLAAKRKPGGPRGGLWELPGGKIEAGETHEQAVIREIAEELGVQVVVLDALGSHVHAYDDVTIELSAFVCRLADGQQPVAREHAELLWCPLERLHELAWAQADRPFVLSSEGGCGHLGGCKQQSARDGADKHEDGAHKRE